MIKSSSAMTGTYFRYNKVGVVTVATTRGDMADTA